MKSMERQIIGARAACLFAFIARYYSSMAEPVTVNQLCPNKFRGAALALVAALLILVAGSPISAQAATIPFTF